MAYGMTSRCVMLGGLRVGFLGLSLRMCQCMQVLHGVCGCVTCARHQHAPHHISMQLPFQDGPSVVHGASGGCKSGVGSAYDSRHDECQQLRIAVLRLDVSCNAQVWTVPCHTLVAYSADKLVCTMLSAYKHCHFIRLLWQLVWWLCAGGCVACCWLPVMITHCS
jgi:hypothetical protein